jgi:hypothetical protein
LLNERPEYFVFNGSVGAITKLHCMPRLVKPYGSSLASEGRTARLRSLVDHALARAERGLAGTLIVEGAENSDIYNRKEAAQPSH